MRSGAKQSPIYRGDQQDAKREIGVIFGKLPATDYSTCFPDFFSQLTAPALYFPGLSLICH
jgi:hypothetical protein